MNSKHLFYFILFVMAIATSCKPGSKEDKKEEAAAAEKPDSALIAISDKISKDPENPDLYNERAKIYFERKDLVKASDDIAKAIGRDSTKAEYFLTYSDIAFVANKTATSKKALEKVLELDPGNVQGNLKLAELYLYVRKYKESLKHLDKVIEKDKYNARAYFIKGMVFKEVGDTNTAISSLQTTIEQDPDYYNAYVQLGLLFAARKDNFAIDYYNSALKLNPRSTEALYNKAIYLQEIGDTAQASQLYKVILTIDSSHAFANYNLGFLAFTFKSDFKTALRQFDKAYKSDPNYVNALYMRGLCYEKLGQTELAVGDYLMVLQLKNDHELANQALKRLGRS